MTAQEKLDQLKAQQEALEAQIKLEEELNTNQIAKEKAIESAQLSLDREIKEIQQQNARVAQWFEKVSKVEDSVELRRVDRTVTKNPFTYIKNDEGKDESWHGEKLSKTTQELQMWYGDYQIFVNEHKVYDSWRSHSNGYKLQFGHNGHIPYEMNKRFYKHPKSLIAKIKEMEAVKVAEREAAKRKANAKEACLADLQEQYPDAIVEIDTEWKHSYHGSGRGYQITFVKVTFENGNWAKFHFTALTQPKDDKYYGISFLEMHDVQVAKLRKNPTALLDHLK